MPLSKYYGGHGRKVMRKMQAKYGPEKAERVFYATARKKKIRSKTSRRLP